MKKKPFPAMYSSVYGGIILDPAMMVLPIDDHMVHRGHGVFDTACLLDGYARTIVSLYKHCVFIVGLTGFEIVRLQLPQTSL